MAAKSPIGRISYRDEPTTGAYSVKAAWKRLKRFSVSNLPQVRGKDDSPATEAQLLKFEKAIGAKLPKDVRESYKTYNGQFAGIGIAFGLEIQPLKDCIWQWKQLNDTFSSTVKDGSDAKYDANCISFPAGFVRPVYFDCGWIPLTDDGSGNHIGVDLNPGRKERKVK